MWTFCPLYCICFPSEFNKNKSTKACVCFECRVIVFLPASPQIGGSSECCFFLSIIYYLSSLVIIL